MVLVLDLGKGGKELERQHDQVVKVNGIIGFEVFLVLLEKRPELPVLRRPRGPACFYSGNDLCGRHEVRGDTLGPELARGLPQKSCLVLRIVNAEVGPVTEQLVLFPEHLGAEGVKR